MSAMPDSALADTEQLIADLQRQPAECEAERDGAPQSGDRDRGGVAGHQFLFRRPRAGIHDAPAAQRAWLQRMPWRSPRGNAERSGRRVARIRITGYPHA